MSSTESVPEAKEAGARAEEKNEELEVDNSRSVLVKMATLYAEQLMSDITLEVGGVGYPAHRLILCASSPVFQVMLMNREWSEWRESCIVLQETSQCAAVFPHFLRYFYTGQIRISHETVLPVLSLADKYNVKDLVSLCLCYMSQHVAHAAQRGQLVAWMQYTMSCGHNDVAQACQNFVKWNVEWVWETGDLGNMEPELLVHLLQQSDLVVHNEMALYNLVVSWLLQQRERLLAADNELSEAEAEAHWEALVPLVLMHVRFPMMGPRQLAKLLLSPLTKGHKDFFMERMAIAMNYQSGHTERVYEVQATEAGRLLFTPRLYTEDTWGTVLAVDNFHSLPCYHTRTFIFSTRPALSESTCEKTCEWTLDLYPKGVWFRKSLLIVWSGTYDVPEVVLRTVRISITCQNPPAPTHDQWNVQDEPDIRIKIGILVWGVQKGVEHVSAVLERVHRFSQQNRVLNIDGALDFDELNTPLYTPGASRPRADAYRSAASAAPPVGKTNSKCAHCPGSCCVVGGGDTERADTAAASRHLLGSARDQLRIQVVMVPLTDACDVTAADG